jgi:hypothetical protein
VPEIEFSFSVNETDPFVVVRAHPSGTDTEKPPLFEPYGTNAVLSGMSPGGLLSAGTGDSRGTGDSVVFDGCGPCEAPVVVGTTVGADVPAPPLEPLAHAADNSATATIAGTTRRT